MLYESRLILMGDLTTFDLNGVKTKRPPRRTDYIINVEKQRAENLAIPFRKLNIGRFSVCGGEVSQKRSNFVLDL